jgi:2-polyprenyl-6-hydroxyphenyl methylase/3-demethylubiquinone-9 3-methyltransferase
MPVDNKLYDAPGDIWWDETKPLHALRTAINPGRVGYLRQVIARLGWRPDGLTALDVGCGGGIMAEEVAALGFRVTGVDPSAESIATARSHAARTGLAIDYLEAPGERLPFAAASFDLVYCCDVLEHVRDRQQVINEAARVLKPGGAYLYDTINRTLPSKLVMIKLFQEWGATAFMPPNLHDWRQFMTPVELLACLDKAGLHNIAMVGLKPAANPLQLISLLRKVKKGRITPAEMGRRSPMAVSRDMTVLYVGYAVKSA